MIRWFFVVLLWSIVVPVILVGAGTANPLLIIAGLFIAFAAWLLTVYSASQLPPLPPENNGRVYEDKIDYDGEYVAPDVTVYPWLM